jgi:flagellar hook-basal body complex protein FliE
MITPIASPAAAIPLLDPSKGAASSTGFAPSSGKEFGSVLADAIGRVEQFQQNAQSTIGKFLAGEDEEVHKVALATQEASMTFDLFLQVRNKVVSAYQEVMRMQM